MPDYAVCQFEADTGTVYSVWLTPWVRQINVKPLTHDEAALLCERLNREHSRSPRRHANVPGPANGG